MNFELVGFYGWNIRGWTMSISVVTISSIGVFIIALFIAVFIALFIALFVIAASISAYCSIALYTIAALIIATPVIALCTIATCIRMILFDWIRSYKFSIPEFILILWVLSGMNHLETENINW